MGSQSELFTRAAACDGLMKLTTDPMKKQLLTQLRDVWITFANVSCSMSPRAIAEEIMRIEAIVSRFNDGEEEAGSGAARRAAGAAAARRFARGRRQVVPLSR